MYAVHMRLEVLRRLVVVPPGQVVGGILRREVNDANGGAERRQPLDYEARPRTRHGHQNDNTKGRRMHEIGRALAAHTGRSVPAQFGEACDRLI
jgi:hypothetical protein